MSNAPASRPMSGAEERRAKSQRVIVEILPNRSRALAMIALSAAIWVFVYFMVNGHSFTEGMLADFINRPNFSGPELTDTGGPLVIIAVAVIALAVNIYTVGVMLMPVPRPRIRITPEGFDYIGAWTTKRFAWSGFGRFSVKKVRSGKTKTIKLRALAPGVEEPSGIAGWFSSGPELLSFDLQAFVPLMQKNIAEGERMARWIVEVRDNAAARPPASLTVRMSTAAPAATMAKVTTNQTVVRR